MPLENYNNLSKLQGVLSKYGKPFVFMEKSLVSDGGGGWVSDWTEGAEFEMAITNDMSTEMRIAEAQGVVSSFTGAIPFSLPLKFNDYVKSKRDNEYYKVTSDPEDMETPPHATVKQKQITLMKVTALP